MKTFYLATDEKSKPTKRLGFGRADSERRIKNAKSDAGVPDAGWWWCLMLGGGG